MPPSLAAFMGRLTWSGVRGERGHGAPEASQRPQGGQQGRVRADDNERDPLGLLAADLGLQLLRAKPSDLDERVQRPAGRPPLLLERPAVVGVLGGPDPPQQAYLVRFSAVRGQWAPLTRRIIASYARSGRMLRVKMRGLAPNPTA